MKKLVMVILMVGIATIAIAADKQPTMPTTDIGKEVVAISQHLQSLAGDFAKSDLGSLTYYTLYWKFLIKPFFNIVVGMIAWIVLNITLLKQVNRFFGSHIEDGRWVENYEFRGDGVIGAGVALSCLGALINLLGFIVVFG